GDEGRRGVARIEYDDERGWQQMRPRSEIIGRGLGRVAQNCPGDESKRPGQSIGSTAPIARLAGYFGHHHRRPVCQRFSPCQSGREKKLCCLYGSLGSNDRARCRSQTQQGGRREKRRLTTMTLPPHKKNPKVLARLRIDEVSMVDRGAGVGCKIVISKRADDGANELPPLSDAERERAEYEGRAAIRDQENIEKREYERIHGTGAADHGPADDDRSGPLYEHFLGIFKGTNKSFAADAAGDEATRQDEAVPVDELHGPPPAADGTSGGVPDKTIRFDVGDKTITARDERALARWLSVQERIHKSNSTEESTTMSLDLSAVVKAHGIGALCRHMIKSATSFGVDEHALVKLATEDAQRKYPTDTPAIAFTKLYTESNELRDAIEIAKGVALQNDVADALAQDSEAACAELTAIGKARWPSLSPAQRFARAFETNPTLAARAHRRPGPS